MDNLFDKTKYNINITEMLILSVLNTKDCCVYEIYKTLLDYSDNKFVLSTDQIDKTVNKLLKSNMLTEYENNNNKESKKYYHITVFGEVRLNRLLHSYFVYVSTVSAVMYQLDKKARS